MKPPSLTIMCHFIPVYLRWCYITFLHSNHFPRQCLACHVSHIPTEFFFNSLQVLTIILKSSVMYHGHTSGQGKTLCNAYLSLQAVIKHPASIELIQNTSLETRMGLTKQLMNPVSSFHGRRRGFRAIFLICFV